MKVEGRRIDLSDDRIVFVGSHEKHGDAVLVALRNSGGHDTFLKLSIDGAAALGRLLTDPESGGRGVFPAADRSEWQPRQ